MLFCGFCVFAQNSSQQEQNSISTAIPNLSPQTPTTANLGKYGEVQVNESTGTITPSIPLFDFYTGANNLPISLQYSGNAVRVTQDPTWVGINWNLNAGGVITREVRDLADETRRPFGNNPSFYTSETALNLMGGANNHATSTSPWYTYLYSVANSNTIDSEVDLFNFNFMGYSGSFFLDDNNVGHLVKYDKELTINLIYDNGGNKSEIIIKTPEGNIYKFGGPDASESSRSYVSMSGGSGSVAQNPFIQNAFYLTEVNYLAGGKLYFDYEHWITYNGAQHSTIIGKQESLKVPNNQPFNCVVDPKRNIIKIIESCVSLKKMALF